MFRSMMFVFAVAFVGTGGAAAEQGAATQGGAGFTVLSDDLKFDIDVTKNDIDVCTVLLGAQFCK